MEEVRVGKGAVQRIADSGDGSIPGQIVYSDIRLLWLLQQMNTVIAFMRCEITNGSPWKLVTKLISAAVLFMALSAALLGLHQFAIAKLPDPISKHQGYATPLLDAVAERDLQKAKRLLEEGSEPDDPGAAASPLVQAITSFDGAQMYCDEPMVKLLLRYGADPNRLDPLTGSSPLEAALVRDSPACAKALRAAGAEPGGLNAFGETILAPAVVAAARTSHMDMVDLALSYGVSPSARGAKGMTALHHAVFARSLPVVQGLLLRGTDPCIPDANGDTPLAYAVSIRSGAHLSSDMIDVLTRATKCDPKKPY